MEEVSELAVVLNNLTAHRYGDGREDHKSGWVVIDNVDGDTVQIPDVLFEAMHKLHNNLW